MGKRKRNCFDLSTIFICSSEWPLCDNAMHTTQPYQPRHCFAVLLTSCTWWCTSYAPKYITNPLTPASEISSPVITTIVQQLRPAGHTMYGLRGQITDLYKYSPDAIPPIHAVSYHVATDNPPPKKATSSGLFFSDNLQPVATRGKNARGTLLVDQHCSNGCSIKYAPLSVSYYNEISGCHIGRWVVRRRCSVGPVLPL